METASTVPVKSTASESGFRYYRGYLRSLLITIPLIYFYTGACGTASLLGSIFDGSGHWQHGCAKFWRSEEHTSELQSQSNIVCRLLLEKKNAGRPRTRPGT